MALGITEQKKYICIVLAEENAFTYGFEVR